MKVVILAGGHSTRIFKIIKISTNLSASGVLQGLNGPETEYYKCDGMNKSGKQQLGEYFGNGKSGEN